MNCKNIFVLILLSGFGCTKQRVANKAAPVKTNGKYHIRIGTQELTVNPAIGGRITSLKLNGENFLTGKKVNSSYWGSTFWPSPQGKWPWPPSAAIDTNPYRVYIVDKEIKTVSQKDPKTEFIITKEFFGNEKDDFYMIKYTITNRSDSTQKVAPWEITRVQTNGFAFFPMGKGKIRGGLVPLTMKKNGIIWFIYKENKIPKNRRKLYADGTGGWVAEVNGQTILVKKFPNVPFEKIAPKEGEIELYTSPVKPGKSYVEIENQGAYQLLMAGDSLTWKVKWYLRKLPNSIKPEIGDTALVAYVESLIKQGDG